MPFKKHMPSIQTGGADRYWRQASDMLGASRAGLESSLAQQNALEGEQYANAGLDVTYGGEDTSARERELSTQMGAEQEAITGRKRGKAGTAAFKAALAKAGIDVKSMPGKNLQEKLAQFNRKSQQESSTLAAKGRTITGIKEKPELAAQKQREQGLLTTEQEDLQRSLSMNADDVLKADPALAQELESQGAQLAQSQVGQFGNLQSAGGGTIGAVQNAAWGRARSAAISDARRQNIGLYQGLQSNQAAQNQGLAQGRMQMAAAPAAQRAATATGGFGQLSQGYAGLGSAKFGEAQAQQQIAAFNKMQPGWGESIVKGIGSLLQPMKSSG